MRWPSVAAKEAGAERSAQTRKDPMPLSGSFAPALMLTTTSRQLPTSAGVALAMTPLSTGAETSTTKPLDEKSVEMPTPSVARTHMR